MEMILKFSGYIPTDMSTGSYVKTTLIGFIRDRPNISLNGLYFAMHCK